MRDLIIFFAGAITVSGIALLAYAVSVIRDNREPKHKRSTYISPKATRGRHKKSARQTVGV